MSGGGGDHGSGGGGGAAAAAAAAAVATAGAGQMGPLHGPVGCTGGPTTAPGWPVPCCPSTARASRLRGWGCCCCCYSHRPSPSALVRWTLLVGRRGLFADCSASTAPTATWLLATASTRRVGPGPAQYGGVPLARQASSAGGEPARQAISISAARWSCGGGCCSGGAQGA